MTAGNLNGEVLDLERSVRQVARHAISASTSRLQYKASKKQDKRRQGFPHFENLSDAYAVISNGLAVKTSWLAGVNEMAKLSAYNDSIKLIPMIDKMQIARNLAYLDRVRARQIKAARLATIKRLALIALFFTAFGLFALYTGAIN